MSEKHVPTTETIKSAHRYYRTGRASVPDEWSHPDYKIVVAHDEAFDRWLDEVKADAWDEGHKEGWGECWVEHTSYGTKPTLARNPYRDQEEA